MFYGLSKFFKNILPKRLFYRALLIVAVPVIVLQLVITFVFFDSLWIKTNKGMTRTLVNEISTFIEAYGSEQKNKQELLSSLNIENRALKCLKFLNIEYEKLALKNDIQSKVRNDLDQQQREYYLQQQMKTIQEELGENSYQEDIQELISKSKNKNWNRDIKEHFEKELAKLKRMNSQVAEYSVQRRKINSKIY